jgi:polyphosphate kinase
MKNLAQIREVSTLSFNERVLQEAEDKRNPLMERLKFLGIFSSNMDEFFKVRMAGIQRRAELGEAAMGGVLKAVSKRARGLDERFQTAYDHIIKGLSGEGLRLARAKEELSKQEVEWLGGYFRRAILPGLVPHIIQDDRPLPPLTDGALYLAVAMQGKKQQYALLEIPETVPRFVEMPDGPIMYVDDVIRLFLGDIFYIFDYDRIAAWELKISRDADLDVDNDFSEDYVRKMERLLQQRKGGRPTRVVYDAAMPKKLLERLFDELKITDQDTTIAGGRYHNMKDLMRFPAHDPALSFERFPVAHHPLIESLRHPMFDTLDASDVLVTYPYQSFGHVVRLLREAAIDPEVRSIKMTLYRAAKNSQMVNALYSAARNGKRVFISIELQARFDEENNIAIAEKLSEVGATVVYGVPPMKTHCKLLLIRKRKNRLYAALSTGNFNEVTGRLYVDSTLLTTDTRLTEEVAKAFDFLKSASRMRVFTPPTFRHLLVSPFNTRKTLYRLLNREKEKGDKGYVLLKVNHLTDERIIQRILAAAKAGVKMDLVVRTTFGMPAHENIRAISILDRYLEHQRVYIFGQGVDRVVYMSSADLMERNLDWRMEVAFPIYDPKLRDEVAHMMAIQVSDKFKARILDENQTNRYVSKAKKGVRTQYRTHRFFAKAAAQSKNKKK